MKDTVRFLKWIRKYPGWWYLICTPDEEHMNLDMMKQLVKRMEEDELYELIFVLLMVHRNASFMGGFFEFAWLDALIAHWEEKQDEIIEGVVSFFE